MDKVSCCRTRARQLSAGAAALVLVAAAGAQPPRADFKGYTLGATRGATAVDGSFQCSKPPPSIGADLACVSTLGETIANAPARSVALFWFGDALELITISFDERHFRQVLDALSVKYATPTTDVTSTVTTRAGSTFEQHEVTWTVGADTVRLQRRAGSVDISRVEFRGSALSTTIEQRKQGHARKNASDL